MKNFLFLLLVLLLAACTDKGLYTINGSSESFADGCKVYLYQRLGDEEFLKINSTVVANNSFVLKGNAETPVDAMILVCDSTSFDEKTFELLDKDASPVVVNLILEPGKINVTSYCGKNEEIQYVVSGAAFNEFYNEIEAGADSVAAAFPNNPDKFFRYIAPVIKKNAANIVGVLAFERYHWSMPKDVKLELLDSFALYYGDKYAALHAETREDWQRQQLREEQAESVQPGCDYKNVVENSVDGAEVSLKSVVENPKNRYVLLEFWGTYCVPCMNEIPYLVDAYAKYKNKGFEIYSVSLNDDKSTNEWVAVVKEKGMKWINVRATDGSNVSGEYGVYGVPANFLIDCATGKIAASGLRGDALKEKLTELFD